MNTRHAVFVLVLLASAPAWAIEHKCPPGQIWSLSQGACVKKPPAPKLSPQEKFNQASDDLEGRGKNPDPKRGVALLEQACTAGHGPSCTLLGFLYSRGRSVARDDKRAMDYFQKACGLKDLEGCFDVGDHAHRTGDYAGARKGFKHACEQGSGVGCARGADLMETGVGGAKDAAGAAPMFKRAYEILSPLCPGDGPACFVVGWMHEHGKGTAKDAAKAIASYRSGCTASSGDACLNLAAALDDGIAGAKDVDGANAAYEKACTQFDSANACQKLGERLGMAKKDLAHAFQLAKRGCELDPRYCGTLAEFYRLGFGIAAVDQFAATKYYKQSCEAGELGWCSTYAQRLHDGTGAGKDFAGAQAALERACQGTYGDACHKAAQYLVDAEESQRDDKRAATLASLGCEHKSGSACWLAGFLAAEGRGSTKSAEHAFQFYEKGCAVKSPASCNSLGNAYRFGTGTAKDPGKALESFKTACEGNGDLLSAGGCKSWGSMAYFAEGMAKDPKLTLTSYTRACEYSEPDTCNFLSVLLKEAGGGKRDDIVKAMTIACKNGYEPACIAHGNVLLESSSEADRHAAYEAFAASCGRKSDEGCLRQADLLADGFGITKNAEKAEQLYRTRCDAGHAGACFGMARLAERNGKTDDAVRLYARACDGGFADSCNVIGYQYYTAKNVRWDVAQAAKYFIKACELGSGSGCANSGDVFRFGAGAPRDHKKAYGYYEKACRPGESSGCSGFGHYLASGEGGVKADKKRAEEALRAACENEVYIVPEACRGLADLLDKKRPADIARLRTTAFTRAQELAKDNPYYMYILGEYYAEGMATVKDPVQALTWLGKSCEGFDPLGCITAGKLLRLTGKPDDKERARVYFERACAAGVDDGCTLNSAKGPGAVATPKGCCGGEAAPGGHAGLSVLVLAFVLRRRNRVRSLG